jgi:hypothetical protein
MNINYYDKYLKYKKKYLNLLGGALDSFGNELDLSDGVQENFDMINNNLNKLIEILTEKKSKEEGGKSKGLFSSIKHLVPKIQKTPKTPKTLKTPETINMDIIKSQLKEKDKINKIETIINNTSNSTKDELEELISFLKLKKEHNKIEYDKHMASKKRSN